MKDVYYFPHDSNARNDPKILALRCVYGWEGVGMYWAIVEILREQTEFKMPLNKYTMDALVMQMQCKRIKIEKFLEDCIKEFTDQHGRGLFESDGTCFWSNSLIERMKKYEEKRDKARAAAEARWSRGRDA